MPTIEWINQYEVDYAALPTLTKTQSVKVDFEKLQVAARGFLDRICED